MEDIVIVAAARTPVGSFLGALSTLSAHELGAVAIKAAIARAGLQPADVDEVILGEVLTAGEGHTPHARPPAPPVSPTKRPPSRSISSAGPACAPSRWPLSRSVPARAASLSPAAESMSMSQHSAYLRTGTKMGGVEFVELDAA